MKMWYILHPHRRWAQNTKHRHLSSGYDVRLSIDDLEALAKLHSTCSFCGVELDYSVGTKNGKILSNSPTLDRIDNAGYLDKDNVSILCNRCNRTKGDRTFVEFVEFCKMIADKFYTKSDS